MKHPLRIITIFAIGVAVMLFGVLIAGNFID